MHFYASRYECLGVLAFSCIMSALSLVLIYETILHIVEYATGKGESIDFTLIPMLIIIITIALKLVLAIVCYFCVKVKKVGGEIVKAYGEDHRNDVITNLVGCVGALLAYRLGGQWKYCDPIASILLGGYIFTNWLQKAIEQTRSLTGYRVGKEEMKAHIMMLIHQLPCSVFIRSIESAVGVISGSQAVLEFRLIVPETFSVSDAHNICQSVQTAFERISNIERCYVHIESDSCENVL